ncbi:winged helix-turn-helix domain-containing protein [Halobacteria archaeon AArc-m2/3/4]|uniref:Winged helix-turn-helix domain-containing protein n=1 Tax=Natronoglomus mannanivorans TaxID=2979990 RepID=A0AAP2Z047_9EURY|nr:winged helix-turn-helix domain-containing protein [Halobacteria archaeon AArc-xg1-1]MCU4974245.1 winged helix-turn-helix domain-containing protein [Halobacteria archaeon AArc-m2/3/4]
MKLRQPTDFLILEALEDKGRNVATNLAAHTGKSRKNINTRLPVLEDYGLVAKIGPAERSGLYELTSLGKAALVYQDQYNEVDDFEALIEGPNAGVSSQPAEAQASFVRGEGDQSDDTDLDEADE